MSDDLEQARREQIWIRRGQIWAKRQAKRIGVTEQEILEALELFDPEDVEEMEGPADLVRCPLAIYPLRTWMH